MKEITLLLLTIYTFIQLVYTRLYLGVILYYIFSGIQFIAGFISVLDFFQYLPDLKNSSPDISLTCIFINYTIFAICTLIKLLFPIYSREVEQTNIVSYLIANITRWIIYGIIILTALTYRFITGDIGYLTYFLRLDDKYTYVVYLEFICACLWMIQINKYSRKFNDDDVINCECAIITTLLGYAIYGYNISSNHILYNNTFVMFGIGAYLVFYCIYAYSIKPHFYERIINNNGTVTTEFEFAIKEFKKPICYVYCGYQSIVFISMLLCYNNNTIQPNIDHIIIGYFIGMTFIFDIIKLLLKWANIFLNYILKNIIITYNDAKIIASSKQKN